MYLQYSAVIVFTLVGFAFVFGNLLLGFLIRAAKTHGDKHEIYECGEPTIGSSWIRYNNRFYNVALVYLLFDVEVVVLIPAALVFIEYAGEGAALGPLIALLVFIGLLILGLAYEWFNGNLDWIKKASHSSQVSGN